MENIRHIVLVDDDHATNVYHEIILKDANLPASYIFFNSAEKALEYLKNREQLPHYIFLDINMPRMDGWEFLDKFSEILMERPNPNIIMLTTSLSTFDNEKSKAHPLVSKIMEKPLSEIAVAQLLNEEQSM